MPSPDELSERLFTALVPALELLCVDLGRRLGFYSALARSAATPVELAQRTGVLPRYAREWLEQQAAAGILTIDDAGAPAERRGYALPAEYEGVLLDASDARHTMGAPTLFASIAAALPAVIDAYRGGAPVSYAQYGEGARRGLELFNRPAYSNDLDGWLDALPDVRERLALGGEVVDVGCGTGWSTIALARALPAAHVTGVDLDEASLTEARRHADEARLGDRVRFVRADATDAAALRDAVGPADLVTIFEALHDMRDPTRMLQALAPLLAADGAVLIADELVEDAFVAPAPFLDRLNYAFSVLHCLPATMAVGQGEANGTVLRAPTLTRWASEAGFTRVERLPVDSDFWAFYRLGVTASTQAAAPRSPEVAAL